MAKQEEQKLTPADKKPYDLPVGATIFDADEKKAWFRLDAFANNNSITDNGSLPYHVTLSAREQAVAAAAGIEPVAISQCGWDDFFKHRENWIHHWRTLTEWPDIPPKQITEYKIEFHKLNETYWKSNDMWNLK